MSASSSRWPFVVPPTGALLLGAALVLVLPGFTTSVSGPRYTPAQLVFVGASSLALWTVFVFFQTVRHRD